MRREDIRPGEIYQVGKPCGVPHGFRPILFRVIKVDDRPTYAGMAWLDGYELNATGAAVDRRRIYVITAGLRPLTPAVPTALPQRRRHSNAGPVRVPRPRTSTESTPGRTR